MRILLFLYAVFVLGPSALLAARAWRGADLQGERHITARRELAERYATLLASSGDVAVAKALREAEDSGVVAYAGPGGEIRWAAPLDLEPGPPGTPEERAWYALSRRGGESFEAAGDPAAALDAYTFHLPRIRAPELRARLRLAATRAALAAGEESLARALLLDLFENAGEAVSDEGYAIDLLAASILTRRWEGAGDLRERAAERLAAKAPRLGTPLLAAWARAFRPGDDRLRALMEGRRTLEAAVAARPEVLRSVDAALVGSTVIFARDEIVEGRGVRTLRAGSFEIPLQVLDPGIEPLWLGPGAAPPDGAVVARTFGGPAAVGTVAVRDHGLAEAIRERDRSRSGQRLSVMAHCAMILVGGLAILLHMRKERELARLRLRLLANVSHELKTPVTSIRMFAEMLSSNGTDPARARGFAGHILRESERLSRLVEDVLDTARPERVEALHPEPVDMAALVRGLASPFAERAREAGVDFRVEGADAGDATIETSAPAVERILSNLLDNALKYRRPRDARIVVGLERAGSGIRVSVRDNGPGIAPRDRARVFDEFYRARYDDYAVKGAGLGLAIARRLARKLGGDILVDSKEGQGSTFTLGLPARASAAAGVSETRKP